MARFIYGTRLAGRAGQVIIPFLLVLPCLMLFVMLIYETAKLSREKIRHQFAADSAAFTQMSHFSDFLNRAAYVNGPFPETLFMEAFADVCIEKKDGPPGSCGLKKDGEPLYNILYDNGAFPRWGDLESEAKNDDAVSLDATDDAHLPGLLKDSSAWKVAFGGYCGSDKDRNPPDLDTCNTPDHTTPPKPGRLDLLTLQDAQHYWITWDEAQDIYRLYVQVYQLLGSVAESQQEILTDAANGLNSYRKSYWLNAGTAISEGDDGAGWFIKDGGRVGADFVPEAHCLQEVMIYGTKPGKSPFVPYTVFAPSAPPHLPDTNRFCKKKGLFQVLTVPSSDLRRLEALRAPGSRFDMDSPGFPVFQHWDTDRKSLGKNFFGVDFHAVAPCPEGGGTPCVHSTVAVTNAAGPGNGLWPEPTPKFQVKLAP